MLLFSQLRQPERSAQPSQTLCVYVEGMYAHACALNTHKLERHVCDVTGACIRESHLSSPFLPSIQRLKRDVPVENSRGRCSTQGNPPPHSKSLATFSHDPIKIQSQAIMTGIAHIELKEVNKCHFLTTKGP